MVRLIASDIDGTLLDGSKLIPDSFPDMLDMLSLYGIRFVIASGRSYSAVSDMFSRYRHLSTFICDNGAFIVTDSKITDISIIPQEVICQIIKILNSADGAYPVLCGRHGTYVTKHSIEHITDPLNHYYNNIVLCSDLSEICDEIFKIAVCDTKDPGTNSYKKVNSILHDELSLQVSGASWMDIMNKGINKGYALNKIQKHLGISSHETMAFGDYYNDIEMLRNAHYSYVMENANQDMLQYGRFTAPSNDKNGVISTVINYINNNKMSLRKGLAGGIMLPQQ